MDDGDYKTHRFTAMPRESHAAEGFSRGNYFVLSTLRVDSVGENSAIEAEPTRIPLNW